MVGEGVVGAAVVGDGVMTTFGESVVVTTPTVTVEATSDVALFKTTKCIMDPTVDATLKELLKTES